MDHIFTHMELCSDTYVHVYTVDIDKNSIIFQLSKVNERHILSGVKQCKCCKFSQVLNAILRHSAITEISEKVYPGSFSFKCYL